MQFVPQKGQQDLAWVDQTIHELNELYNQLLRMQVATDIVDEPTKHLTQSEKTDVDLRCSQIGTPLVQVSGGSIILHLFQQPAVYEGASALTTLGLILRKGPEFAALPNKIKQRRYSSAKEALAARMAYEQLKQQSDVRVMEEPAR